LFFKWIKSKTLYEILTFCRSKLFVGSPQTKEEYLVKFVPRRDFWLSITIWVCITGLALAGLSPLFFGGAGIFGGIVIFLFCFVIAGFIAWSWIATYYVLKESELLIRNGPFTKLVPFESITKVEPIRSWTASAATSIHKVEIYYGKFNLVYVSPLNQETFLKELKTRCPRAHIELR
jgi:hypothetical protein